MTRPSPTLLVCGCILLAGSLTILGGAGLKAMSDRFRPASYEVVEVEAQPGATETPVAAPQAGSASCRWKVKQQLRDPDSFREEEFRPAADGTALLIFRSRNGFGGYARGAAICSGSGDGATAQLIGQP